MRRAERRHMYESRFLTVSSLYRRFPERRILEKAWVDLFRSLPGLVADPEAQPAVRRRLRGKRARGEEAEVEEFSPDSNWYMPLVSEPAGSRSGVEPPVEDDNLGPRSGSTPNDELCFTCGSSITPGTLSTGRARCRRCVQHEAFGGVAFKCHLCKAVTEKGNVAAQECFFCLHPTFHCDICGGLEAGHADNCTICWTCSTPLPPPCVRCGKDVYSYDVAGQQDWCTTCRVHERTDLGKFYCARCQCLATEGDRTLLLCSVCLLTDYECRICSQPRRGMRPGTNNTAQTRPMRTERICITAAKTASRTRTQLKFRDIIVSPALRSSSDAVLSGLAELKERWLSG